MTNRQWLLEKMQNMSDEEFAEVIFIPKKMEEEKCKDFSCSGGICSVCKLDWLKAEHKEKPKLSDAERVILENLPKIYGYITRDANGNLFIYQIPPVKIDKRWFCNLTSVHISPFAMFNDLFQFIKWEDTEPYNIADLLKGE